MFYRFKRAEIVAVLSSFSLAVKSFFLHFKNFVRTVHRALRGYWLCKGRVNSTCHLYPFCNILHWTRYDSWKGCSYEKRYKRFWKLIYLDSRVQKSESFKFICSVIKLPELRLWGKNDTLDFYYHASVSVDTAWMMGKTHRTWSEIEIPHCYSYFYKAHVKSTVSKIIFFETYLHNTTWYSCWKERVRCCLSMQHFSPSRQNDPVHSK